MTRILLVVTMITASFCAVGCNFNIFSPFDSPHGDEQILSAARAALDRGDFDEADKQYRKLSSADAEIAASEEAYTTLTRYHAGMAAFASAFGSGGGGGAGKAITHIADDVGPSASKATRLDIFHAFQQTGHIPSNDALRGLVRFLTATALIAEMLAEGAVDPTHLKASDLTAVPVACAAHGGDTGGAACATTSASDCGPAATNTVLVTGPTTVGDLTTAQDSDIEAGPSLSLIQSAIDQIKIALGPTEIGSSGKLSGAVNGFTSDDNLKTLSLSVSGAPCYRYALLHVGIGE